MQIRLAFDVAILSQLDTLDCIIQGLWTPYLCCEISTAFKSKSVIKTANGQNIFFSGTYSLNAYLSGWVWVFFVFFCLFSIC